MSDQLVSPSLSIILPLYKEEARLRLVARDLVSFFGRMGPSVELVFVIDPPHHSELSEGERNRLFEGIRFQWIENSKRLGRGPSVRKGLEAAKGEFMITCPADLTIPLGDILRVYQEFLHSRQQNLTELFAGNRMHKGKSTDFYPSAIRRFFEKVEVEKLAPLKMKDPTSPVLGLSREVLQLLFENNKPIRRWFYGSSLFSEAQRKAIPIREVPLIWNPTAETRFSWWQALI